MDSDNNICFTTLDPSRAFPLLAQPTTNGVSLGESPRERRGARCDSLSRFRC
jgi:hypothetical protein